MGFRFHGWQKQTEMKTIQGTIETVVYKLFPDQKTKMLGGSRTDSMVSAEKYVFMLILKESEIKNIEIFIEQFNYELPPDIKILKIEEIGPGLSLIQNPKLKEYRYYFSSGNFKPHPLSAPIVTHIMGELDIDLMKSGAEYFIGTHNFKKYCFRPHLSKDFIKTIDHCSIEINDYYTANFLPPETFYFRVCGHSFMRHQIRLMVGTLFRLGLHEITLDEVKESLQGLDDKFLGFLAPASGLFLHDVVFDLEKYLIK